jgi:hypothetical protein
MVVLAFRRVTCGGGALHMLSLPPSISAQLREARHASHGPLH